MTAIEELIKRFEKGIEVHTRMLETVKSPTEKNRHSHLLSHCESVVSIATNLLGKEKQQIVDAAMNWYEGVNDLAGEQYYNELKND
tara:strand:- start:220 stop:477 length:258 start_codon:yes stop_codon:yes gene_type:complete